MKSSIHFALAIGLLVIPALGAEDVQPRIAWYGTLEQGLAEAQRSNRPILLVSGAPQCLGVSGIW